MSLINLVSSIFFKSATPPSCSSSTPQRPYRHLPKLSQELRGGLDAQKQQQDVTHQHIQTLRRSYTEAQDAVDPHHADVQALQTKLAAALAEIFAGEQAVVRMRNELKLEQERSKEQEEEHGRSEATLRAQLKDSEDRLRDVEAHLLERNQALRHLEQQQALQRDHLRETQRLQERLQEVTARLAATEDGRALKEERLREEQRSIQEGHERERQGLCRRLAEAQTAAAAAEQRLQEAQQQVETLLRGQQASGGPEHRDHLLRLQEELHLQTDAVEALRESTRRLEDERRRLTCRCQELVHQIAEADREVNKLRGRLEAEEADYHSLETSYHRATLEFQRMSQVLREKEDEVRQTKDTYEGLVRRREEDLNEALVKMTALGTSLEETEQKLQQKEELLRRMSQVEPGPPDQELQAQLGVAEDRIEALEQHLDALQLGYAGVHPGGQQVDPRSKAEGATEEKGSQAKRPRIRFSSIQGQKYNNVDEADVGGDPERFISIIRGLEAKLTTTEEHLRNVTQSLKDQQSSSDDPCYAKALVCVERSREEVRALLLAPSPSTAAQLDPLSKVEGGLFTASRCLHHGPKAPEAPDGEGVRVLAQTLLFEAEVLSRMSSLVRTSRSDLLRALAQMWEDLGAVTTGDRDCLAVVYADVLTKKMMLESTIGTGVEGGARSRGVSDVPGTAAADLDASTVFNTLVRAELAYSVQNLKVWYEEKVQTLRGDLARARRNLHRREGALRSIFEGAKRSDWDRVVREVEQSFGSSREELADVLPPELAPYKEQVESEEARVLAEEILDRLCAEEMAPPCGGDSVESLGHDALAAELQRQAGVLRTYARQLESGGSPPGLTKMTQSLVQQQASPGFTCSSLGLHDALVQAQVAYVACRFRSAHERDLSWREQTRRSVEALVQQHACSVGAIQERYEGSLEGERSRFQLTLSRLHTENVRLKEEAGRRLQQLERQQQQLALLEERFHQEMDGMKVKHKRTLAETTEERQPNLKGLLLSMDTVEEQMGRRVHTDEMDQLRSQYEETTQGGRGDVPPPAPADEATTPMEEDGAGKEGDPMVVLKGRIQELETQMDTMRDELENKQLGGAESHLREKYQRDFDRLKVSAL